MSHARLVVVFAAACAPTFDPYEPEVDCRSDACALACMREGRCLSEAEPVACIECPQDVEVLAPEPPRAPAAPRPPVMTPCLDGWSENEGRCLPQIDDTCGPGEASFPAHGCRRLGRRCSPPIGVAPVAREGDDLQAMIVRVPIGGTIWLDAGLYTGSLVIDRSITLRGTCTEETVIRGTVLARGLVDVVIEDATVVSGEPRAIVGEAGARLALRGVQIEASGAGLLCISSVLDLFGVAVTATATSSIGLAAVGCRVTGESVAVHAGFGVDVVTPETVVRLHDVAVTTSSRTVYAHDGQIVLRGALLRGSSTVMVGPGGVVDGEDLMVGGWSKALHQEAGRIALRRAVVEGDVVVLGGSTLLEDAIVTGTITQEGGELRATRVTAAMLDQTGGSGTLEDVSFPILQSTCLDLARGSFRVLGVESAELEDVATEDLEIGGIAEIRRLKASSVFIYPGADANLADVRLMGGGSLNNLGRATIARVFVEEGASTVESTGPLRATDVLFRDRVTDGIRVFGGGEIERVMIAGSGIGIDAKQAHTVLRDIACEGIGLCIGLDVGEISRFRVLESSLALSLAGGARASRGVILNGKKGIELREGRPIESAMRNVRFIDVDEVIPGQ